MSDGPLFVRQHLQVQAVDRQVIVAPSNRTAVGGDVRLMKQPHILQRREQLAAGRNPPGHIDDVLSGPSTLTASIFGISVSIPDLKKDAPHSDSSPHQPPIANGLKHRGFHGSR
jgi:hypothetical protein